MLPKAVLAKIHIAKKELKLCDLVYRDLLRANSGKESAKDLTPGEADKVLDHFKALGWKIKSPSSSPSHQGRGTPTSLPRRGEGKGGGKKYDDLGRREGMASPAQLRLIEVTWMNNKAVREKTPEALRKFIENQFGISSVRFIESHDVGKVLKAIGAIRAKTI